MSKNSYSPATEMWWVDQSVGQDETAVAEPEWLSPLHQLDVVRAIKAARAEKSDPMRRFRLQSVARDLFAAATGMAQHDERGLREVSGSYDRYASRFDFNDEGLHALEQLLEMRCCPPVQLTFSELE